MPNNYTRQTYFFAECFCSFAECICLSSVSTNGHSANVLTDGTRTDECPRGGSLPSVFFVCRVPNFAECFFAFFAKCNYFAECFFTALDKELLCRVPYRMHSVNLFLCRLPNIYTRQTYFFAECICLSSVYTNGHSANVLTDGTRTDEYPHGGSLPCA